MINEVWCNSAALQRQWTASPWCSAIPCAMSTIPISLLISQEFACWYYASSYSHLWTWPWNTQLELHNLGQELAPDLKGADSIVSSFTLSCKLPHWALEVRVQQSQQNTSLAKRTDVILSLTDQTLSSPWLCAEILLVKITHGDNSDTLGTRWGQPKVFFKSTK